MIINFYKACKKVLVLSLLVAGGLSTVYAMQPEPTYLDLLPKDLHTLLIPFKLSANVSHAVESAKTLNGAIKNIKDLAQQDSKFNELLMNNKTVAGLFITHLAKKFRDDIFYMTISRDTNSNEELEDFQRDEAKKARVMSQEETPIAFVASRLDTPAALAWLKDYLHNRTEGEVFGMVHYQQNPRKALGLIYTLDEQMREFLKKAVK